MSSADIELERDHGRDGRFVACRDCDLLVQEVSLRPGAAAKCPRCGAVLYRNKPDGMDRTLAFTVAGLILFVVANAFPLMAFQLQGRSDSNRLITGVLDLFAQGMWELASLVFLTSILAPLVYLCGMLYVLGPLRLGRRPPGLAVVFKFVRKLRSWAMLEVYTLGIFVAFVKLADFGAVEAGVALYAFFLLIFALYAADLSLDPRDVWRRVEEAE
ncbi:MAG: paraquat-inducible protein A [Kiloniellales bacterium]|nr:paraquat-inducible protein A [Kiloniellales bacterium]